ncbi:hypothetical protein D9611_001779 [Ephemerocybe angulata]|uniref:Uncharacterized protein n=1 Tax=Ephemerocybe angulata TaxID=980116 RepID=A0A8H5CJ12_9AGAR|nr:hypothetical protein D9611_001779 [Tulosesus angulatus]
MNPDEVAGITSLPVELLHDVQLLALSESLPYISKRFYHIYEASSPLYRAKYLFFRLFDIKEEAELYTRALRYPLCDIEVFDALRGLVKRDRPSTKKMDDLPQAEAPMLDEGPAQPTAAPTSTTSAKAKKRKRPGQFDLPRRLFKNLVNRPKSEPQWTDSDAPLPFLRHLFGTFKDNDDIRINANANNGYALTKAVHVQFLPLVRFLLSNGASPETKDCIAIMVAIRQKNLALVKLLIERQDQASPSANSSKKRRKLEDRVKPDVKMLKVAMQCKARDITEYLHQEKGVVPDIQTLQMMM